MNVTYSITLEYRSLTFLALLISVCWGPFMGRFSLSGSSPEETLLVYYGKMVLK